MFYKVAQLHMPLNVNVLHTIQELIIYTVKTEVSSGLQNVLMQTPFRDRSRIF